MHLQHTWTDDFNHLGYGFGCDGMVTSHHDDLYACTPALFHSVRHVGTRRINKSHQTHKTELVHWKVDFIRVKFVPLGIMLRIQFQVGKSV